MTYRFLEHTGEVELELEASSEEALLAEALAALRELTGGSKAGMPERRELEIVASDSSLLLAEWLAELTVLAELEQFASRRLSRVGAASHRISSRP
jgi:SHS2 domain-containing protein